MKWLTMCELFASGTVYFLGACCALGVVGADFDFWLLGVFCALGVVGADLAPSWSHGVRKWPAASTLGSG